MFAVCLLAAFADAFRPPGARDRKAAQP